MKIELPKGNHQLKYATREPVLLSLGGTPIATLSGSGRLVLRGVQGILETDPPKAKVGLEVITRKNEGEEFDDLPPPQPAPPSNFLMALRQKVKMSMGIIREEFADHQSIYEAGYEDDVFEEERSEYQKKLREEAAREAAEAETAAAKENLENLRQPDTPTSPPPGDKNSDSN